MLGEDDGLAARAAADDAAVEAAVRDLVDRDAADGHLERLLDPRLALLAAAPRRDCEAAVDLGLVRAPGSEEGPELVRVADRPHVAGAELPGAGQEALPDLVEEGGDPLAAARRRHVPGLLYPPVSAR